MNDTTLICNEEACLLNILLTHQEKQHYILENCNSLFFTDSEFRDIFKIAKEEFENTGIINISKISERDKTLTKTLIKVIQEPLSYASYTEIYCNNLCEKYINSQIVTAKTNKDLKKIEEIRNQYITSTNKIKQIADDADDFEKRYKEKRKTAITTSYTTIDDIIGSFIGGDYIALGASTGMGKTTIALNIANRLAMQDKNVLYFSLEMTLEQLQNRFVCMVMGLNAMKFRTQGFTDVELEKYKQGLKGLKKWKMNVVCDYRLTPEKLKMYAEKQKKKGLDFIIIDYLGLLSGYNNKTMYEKTTLLSREIKLLATELNVPILVLVQLNRDLKSRQNKRPVLSDIRESGAIEQDADFVMFAHRESIYDPNIDENSLEIIFAKNRHGKSNITAELDINLETQCITDKRS